MITGECLCGTVRYEAAGNPLFAVLCHCRDCQRASGTGHVPVMGMPKSSFSVRGERKTYTVRATRSNRSGVTDAPEWHIPDLWTYFLYARRAALKLMPGSAS